MGHSRVRAAVTVLIALAGIVTGLIWGAGAAMLGWRQGLFAAVLLLTLGLALWHWQRQVPGHLQWDGRSWSWVSHGATRGARVTVDLDFQFALVLTVQLENGSRISLWPERRTNPLTWSALRRAVHSHSSRAGDRTGRLGALG